MGPTRLHSLQGSSVIFFPFSFISPLSCCCHSVLNMCEQSHHKLLGLSDAVVHSGLLPLVSEPAVTDCNEHTAPCCRNHYKLLKYPTTPQTCVRVCWCIIWASVDSLHLGRTKKMCWPTVLVIKTGRGCPSKSPLFSTSLLYNHLVWTHRLRKEFSKHTWTQDSSILFVLAVVLAPRPRETCPEIRFSPSAINIIQPDLPWPFSIVSRDKCLDGMPTSKLFADNIGIW